MSEITIEADTVEDALAEVAARLGPAARIVRADRVRRGGIAGFFAREVVEVVAVADEDPTTPDTDPSPGDAGDGAASRPGGVDHALERMLAAAEQASFAEVLGRTLVSGDGPAAAPAAGARAGVAVETPPRTAAEPSAPSEAVPGVHWDVGRLLEMGLPSAYLEALAGLDPADDLAHLSALARALAPLCGPVPPGRGRMTGPRADRLAAALGTGPSGDWIHLVVGDEGAPAALTETPTVVSWVSERGAIGAIRVAHLTGATLGYGMSSGFGAPAHRVTALDAAWAVRELAERP